MESTTTVGHRINSLFRHNRIPRGILNWPPEIFAVSAYLLEFSGTYCSAIGAAAAFTTRKPDQAYRASRGTRLSLIGARWRKGVATRNRIPKHVRHCWERVLSFRTLAIAEALNRVIFVEALLDLLAIADEACKEIAYPNKTDEFQAMAYALLVKTPETLCRWIPSDIARVLPKVHTPQVGMTLRSLTHYLSFCSKCEVAAAWYPIQAKLATKIDASLLVNLLIVPYPYENQARSFLPSPSTVLGRGCLPDEFGFFDYRPPPAGTWIQNDFKELMKKHRHEEIHGVIFPEASLSSKEEFLEAYAIIRENHPKAFFLAGISKPGNLPDELGLNLVPYAVPIADDMVCLFSQSKHHRWRIDADQVKRYKLTSLNQGRIWWEHIDITSRKIHFFSVKEWLTFCFLICEDLARQEPVAPLVRAVAPHLIVALLQDGPQLSPRWANRYAGVLADDPGSGVLTLTNMGMIRACQKRPAKTEYIGIWRDRNQTCQLDMKSTSKALLLKLRSERVTEFSADGRNNPRASALFYEKHLSLS